MTQIIIIPHPNKLLWSQSLLNSIQTQHKIHQDFKIMTIASTVLTPNVKLVIILMIQKLINLTIKFIPLNLNLIPTIPAIKIKIYPQLKDLWVQVNLQIIHLQSIEALLTRNVLFQIKIPRRLIKIKMVGLVTVGLDNNQFSVILKKIVIIIIRKGQGSL